MRRPCPVLITCPGIGAPEPDWPVLNLSAEAPDPLIFYRINYPDYDPYDPVCLFNCETPPDANVTCADIISSTESQEMADLLAQAAGIVCPFPTTGNCEFFNDEQTATVTCFDGSTSSFTVPAGAMTSGPISCTLGDAWVAMANAWAMAYAQQKASELLECSVRSFPTGGAGPGSGSDPPAFPPGHVPGSARLYDNPGWCCVGETLDPLYNTYAIVGGSAITGYTFEISAGSLPPGTALIQLGPRSAEVAGIPTTPGQYNYTIRATSTSLPTRVVEVADVFYVMGITNPDLPDAEASIAYSEQFVATGGTAPFTFTTSDPIPAGLILDSDGTLHGTTVDIGAWSFDVTVTDSEGGVCVQTASLFVENTCVPDAGPNPNGSLSCVLPATLSVSDWNAYKVQLIAPGADPNPPLPDPGHQTEWDGTFPVQEMGVGAVWYWVAGTIPPVTYVAVAFNDLLGQVAGVVIQYGGLAGWYFTFVGSVGGVPTIIWQGQKARGENPIGTYMMNAAGIATGPACLHVTGPATPTALAWWAMETNPNAEPDSANGLLLLNPQLAYWVSHVAGHVGVFALRLHSEGGFESISQCQTTNLSITSNGITIAFWCRATYNISDPGGNVVDAVYRFYDGVTTHNLTAQCVEGGNWTVYLDGVAGPSKAFVVGWHFIAVTYNPVTGNIGLDINQSGVVNAAGATTSPGANAGTSMYVAAAVGGGLSGNADIDFDELTLYNGVLTTAQLDCIYNAGAGRTW